VTPKRQPIPAAERVLEKHGLAECTVETAARVLRVSPADVVSLVESGDLRSPRRDPLGELVIDYGSVIDCIVTLRKRKGSEGR